MKNSAVILILVLAFSGFARAEIPEILKGTWILNAEATEAHMKSLPQWKEQDAKYLPMVLKHMSAYEQSFTDTELVLSINGQEKMKGPLSFEQKEGDNYILSTKLNGKDVILTVNQTNDGNLIIKSSATNDMDHYLWKQK
jgi:hypothetical protein